MPRILQYGLACFLVLMAACSPASTGSVGELPPIDGDGIRALIDESDSPLVINIWASWCGPCRSEAPLLRAAHAEFGDQVRFVGIDTQDSQAGAAEFIDEFGLSGFEHWFDPTASVRGELGGLGVPITYFVSAGGDVQIHAGIIDERSLVLGIDEITAN